MYHISLYIITISYIIKNHITHISNHAPNSREMRCDLCVRILIARLSCREMKICLPFQATFKAARVGLWRRSTPGSISCRDKWPRWSTRWPATSDWSWVCSSRRSIRRGRARASRWCQEPRQPARSRAAARPRWSRDRRASRSHRRSRRATETGRSSPARRTACSGKNETKLNEISRVEFPTVLIHKEISRIAYLSRALRLDVIRAGFGVRTVVRNARSDRRQRGSAIFRDAVDSETETWIARSNRYFVILEKPSFEIPGSVAFDFGVFYFGKVGQIPKVTTITYSSLNSLRAVSRRSSPSERHATLTYPSRRF